MSKLTANIRRVEVHTKKTNQEDSTMFIADSINLYLKKWGFEKVITTGCLLYILFAIWSYLYLKSF